ncbi:DNA ligase 4 [Eumeta japonica]|uniref:DNA ligase (ATP) n=1 Tax=Eumeta variegata TaxID=151549 RepID=A0A4C1ZU77_EUMVA|nr:DNA ligase 4 [Eumeta japonica]
MDKVNFTLLEQPSTSAQILDANLQQTITRNDLDSELTNKFLRGEISFDDYSREWYGKDDEEDPNIEESADILQESFKPEKANTTRRRKRTRLSAALLGLMGEANIRFVRGDREMAEKMCHEIIRQVPTAAEPYQTLAEIYENNPEKSLQFSLLAALLGSSNSEEWLRLAAISKEKNDPKQEMLCYTEAIKADPHNLSIHLKRLELLKTLEESGFPVRVLKLTPVKCYHKIVTSLPVSEGKVIMSYAKQAATLYHNSNEIDKALEVMSVAYNKCSGLFMLEDANLYLELLISQREFHNCIEVFVATVGIEIEAEVQTIAVDDNIEEQTQYINCNIPENVPIDLRCKLLICLTHLGSIDLVSTLLDDFLKNSVESAGDLYVDIEEALTAVGEHTLAFKLLDPLVKNHKFNLGAVWLKHAECLYNLGKEEEAVSSYNMVIKHAPQHADARRKLFKILEKQGRDDEALQVLEQDPKYVVSGSLMYEHCCILRRYNKPLKFLEVGEALLSKTFVRFRHPGELKIARMVRGGVDLVHNFRLTRGENPYNESDLQFDEEDVFKLSAADEWEFLKELLKIAYITYLENKFRGAEKMDETSTNPAELVSFKELCKLLEEIKIKNSKKEELLYNFLNHIRSNCTDVNRKNLSFFPILRLLTPKLDRERDAYKLKEGKLRALILKVLGLHKDSPDGKKLLKSKDFAGVVYFVLKTRGCGSESLNIKDINDTLDKIVFKSTKNKAPTLDDIFSQMLTRITAEEYMWFLQIILKDLKLEGLSAKKILHIFHPDAPEFYDKCNNLLKKDCDENEMKKFLSLLIWMGLRRLHKVSNYWSHNVLYENTVARSTMSRNRFELLLRCWYFEDMLYQGVSSTDRLITVCEELSEGHFRPSSYAVELFFAVSPMRCERLDINDIGKLSATKTYEIETKFDGERFQIHMKNGKFEYFSRKGFNFTNKFGNRYDCDGLLTPDLKGCINEETESFILDGEMMGWHKEKQCFGSKGRNFDVKKLVMDSKYKPCFCVFDILYYNGKPLVSTTEKGGIAFQERVPILNKIITDKPGTIIKSIRKKVGTSSDIIRALEDANAKGEEGIVVKDVKSYYVANCYNGGWYKIKPEYTDNLMTDLDVVIVGSDYVESKKRTILKSFFLALVDNNQDSGRWLTIGRVSTGLSFEERKDLNNKLKNYWQPFETSPAPPCLVWGKEKPDHWIHPEHSIVLQVRATELVRSQAFATEYTLRFPRVEKIREDKPVTDILSLDQFLELIKSKDPVIKLSKEKLDIDNVELGTVQKTRKRAARPIEVAAPFRKAKTDTVESPLSRALRDRKLVVLSDDFDCNKEELEKIICSHSGIVVQYIVPDIWSCIAGKQNFLVQNAINTEVANILSTTWLRTLPNSDEPCALPQPLDFVFMTLETRAEYCLKYDKFGDSYTEIIDEDTLKKLFKKMDFDDHPKLYLMADEISELDQQLFNGPSPFSSLRNI